MKTVSIQLPTIPRRVRGPSAAGLGPILLAEGIRLYRCWFTVVRPLRVVLSGLLDSSPYRQISSGREISVVFTANGPLLYRCETDNAGNPNAVGSLRTNR